MRRNRAADEGSDEDLYSGYNEFPSGLSTDNLEFDESFQNSARNVADRRPVLVTSRGRTATGNRLRTSAGFTRDDLTTGSHRSSVGTRGGTARPITGIGGESGGLNRPMTAVRGAGYTTSRNQRFDPLNQSMKTSIDVRSDDSPETKIKQIEEKISAIIEDSVLANCKGTFSKALEHGKDAQQKERSLMKLREQASLLEGHDWDISFSVLFNLANQYESCEMYTEALSTYQSITKNKFLVHGAKVKINMGNIYLKQNQPTRAIKMYRMAMDQLANSNRSLRLKLMHNMGIVFLKINHAEDAAASFEYIMTERPTFKTGLHLIVANFMASDQHKTKLSFQELLQVPVEIDDEDKYTPITDDPVSQLLVEVLKTDKLWKFEKDRRTYAERCVLSAARLIAPFIELSFTEGYHWVTEAIKSSRHAPLAHALEISKALVFLKQRELSEAVEILKSFEKKETKVATAAATNLSFLFYLQGDLDQAEKYGEVGKLADFYNSSALVNLGNCLATRGELDRAKSMYLEAVSMDSSSVEALYNLGLMSQRLKFYEEALDYFHKILVLVRHHSHVLYQIGRTHELMGELELAMEWFLKALALSPTDDGILTKMATMYERDSDRRQAYQYYYDAYKCNPANIDVIEWIASYMLSDVNVPERAIIFYKQCHDLRPAHPKWLLAVGACYKKIGNSPLAFEYYHKAYTRFPENVQALQQLIKLSKETGKDSKIYLEELRKLEKAEAKRTKSSADSAPAANFPNRTPVPDVRVESPWSRQGSSSMDNLTSPSPNPKSTVTVPSNGGKTPSRQNSSVSISSPGSSSALGQRPLSQRLTTTTTSGYRTMDSVSDDDVDDFFSKQTMSPNFLQF